MADSRSHFKLSDRIQGLPDIVRTVIDQRLHELYLIDFRVYHWQKHRDVMVQLMYCRKTGFMFGDEDTIGWDDLDIQSILECDIDGVEMYNEGWNTYVPFTKSSIKCDWFNGRPFHTKYL